jgi:hypothetical protein
MPYKDPAEQKRWENRPENRAKRLARAKQYYSTHALKVSQYNKIYYEERKLSRRENHQKENLTRRARITESSGVKSIRITYPDCGTYDYMTAAEFKHYETDLTDSLVERKTGSKWVAVATQEMLI